MYLNIIVMLLAISVYQAVFNNTGMVGAISDGLIKICPKFMLEYIHIILLLLCVIIIYFIPFQIFNAMYPVFISIGAGFGIPAVTIIAPFVCNLSGNKFNTDELINLSGMCVDRDRCTALL